MKDLLAGKQMLFTELQNSAAFKSYRNSKFGNLVGFLTKKDGKFEIWNITYTHEGKKSLFINL